MRLYITVLFLLTIKLNAQTIYKHLTKEDGLPSNNISNSVQDKDGYIFIGTDNGIARYDGKTIKTFTVDDGLTSNEVTGFFLDSTGRVWIFCFGGDLCFYKDGKIYNKNNFPKLREVPKDFFSVVYRIRYSSSYIQTFAVKYVHTKHICYYRSLNIHSLEFTEKIVDMPFEYYPNSLNHNSLLYTFKENDKGYRHIYNTYVVKRPISLIILRNRWLIQIKNYDFLILDSDGNMINKFKLNDIVRSTIEGPRGEIYFLYQGNIKRIVENRIEPIDLGLKITSFQFDRSGNLWIASPTGVYQILASNLVSNKRSKIVNRPIFSLNKFENAIYAGLDMNCVYDLKKDKLQLFPKQAQSESRVLDFMQLNNTLYTIGDDFSYNLNNSTLVQFSHFARKSSVQLTLKEALNATFRSLEYVKYENGKLITNEIYPSRAFNVFRSRNKTIWFGTESGLKIMDSSLAKYRDVSLPIPNTKIVKHIQEDRHGTMLFSTNNGVVMKHDNKYFHLHRNNGLLDNAINKTIPSQNGNYLFVCTNLGINKVKYRIDGSKMYYSVHTYNQSHGLPSEVVYTALEDSGQLLVGTREGLATLPVHDTIHPYRIPFKLESLRVHDSSQEVLNTKWNHTENSFQFRFSGFYFQRSKELQFSYQLTPIDKKPIVTDNPSITYRGLAPGDYSLKVYAFDRHYPQIIRSQTWTYSFRISPPYYKTWWFYTLITLFLVSTIFISYILYLRSKQKRELEVQTLLKQMSQHRLDALKGQMNPHFIFNSLNTVQHFIASHNVREAVDFIAKFSALIRKMLEFARVDKIRLDKEIQFLKDYASIEQIRYSSIFDVRFHVEIEEVDEIQIPTMLIQPLLENAVKHGVSNLKDLRGLIDIRISFKDETMLYVQIIDNGSGTVKDRQSSKSHTSAALNIIRERLAVYDINGNIGSLDIQFSEHGTISSLLIPI